MVVASEVMFDEDKHTALAAKGETSGDSDRPAARLTGAVRSMPDDQSPPATLQPTQIDPRLRPPEGWMQEQLAQPPEIWAPDR